MRPRFAAVLIVLLLSQAIAQEAAAPPAVIPATDTEALKSKAAGSDIVIVEGKVATANWSRSGQVMRITFEDTGEHGFVAVIFVRQRKAFDEAYGGSIADALKGASVRLTGPITEYEEAPQMILNKTSQLEIVDR